MKLFITSSPFAVDGPVFSNANGFVDLFARRCRSIPALP